MNNTPNQKEEAYWNRLIELAKKRYPATICVQAYEVPHFVDDMCNVVTGTEFDDGTCMFILKYKI